MPQHNRLILGTVLAGSLALATLGVVRAQSMPTTVTTAVTANTSDSVTTAAPMVGRGVRHQAMLEEHAQKLGLTTDQLQQEIASGKPMYQINAEHGLTYEQTKASHLTDLKARLDDMVKVGYMTQAQADAAYTEAQNSTMIGSGPGFGGPRGHRM